MKLKAYDLMKAAAENPQEYEGKRYKVVEGSYLWFGADNRDECIIVNGRLTEKNRHSTLSVYADTILEEIKPEPKPVPFMDAVNSGKRIRPDSAGYPFDRPQKYLSLMDDGYDMGENWLKYINGQWFIEE